MPPTWRCFRSCRTGSASRSFCSSPSSAFPLLGSNFLLNSVLIPFLIFALAAIGLNLLTGYTGLLSLGTGALHGSRRLRLPEAHDHLSARQHHRLDHRLGFLLGRGRRAVRPAVAAHQGLLSGGGDACRAVLSGMVLHPHSLALQQQRLGGDRSAVAHHVWHSDHRSDRDLADALSDRTDPSSSS